MLAPAIDVQQIYKVFPALIEALYVRGNLFGAGELSIVRIDLVFHPAQVLDGFALAWIEAFNQRLALLLAQFQQALFFSAIDEAAIV